jgi:DNA-binding Lrp family transcriptional regulator
MSAVIDYRRLGLETYLLYIKPKQLNDIFKIFNILCELKGVFSVYLFSTDGPIMRVKIKVKPSRLDSLINNISMSLTGLIEPVTIVPVRKTYMDQGVPVSETQLPETLPIDEKDWTMLSMLQKNSFATLKDISDRLKISEPSVYSRMKKIKQHNIVPGYKFSINWENVPKEAYSLRALFTGRINPTEIPKVIEWVKSDANYSKGMRSAYEVYGDMNFNFGLTVNSIMDLQKFIEDMLKRFAFDKLEIGVLLNVRWNKNPVDYMFMK